MGSLAITCYHRAITEQCSCGTDTQYSCLYTPPECRHPTARTADLGGCWTQNFLSWRNVELVARKEMPRSWRTLLAQQDNQESDPWFLSWSTRGRARMPQTFLNKKVSTMLTCLHPLVHNQLYTDWLIENYNFMQNANEKS